jgi:hypothetical protein
MSSTDRRPTIKPYHSLNLESLLAWPLPRLFPDLLNRLRIDALRLDLRPDLWRVRLFRSGLRGECDRRGASCPRWQPPVVTEPDRHLSRGNCIKPLIAAKRHVRFGDRDYLAYVTVAIAQFS